MAIAFQSISTVATGDGVTSLACNAPSGVTSGDLLILCIVISAPGTITTPSGWTQRQNAVDGFSAQRTAMYERIADGSGSDTPTVTVSVGDVAAFIVRINGQKATSPYDTSNSATQTSGSTAAVATISTSENDELLIACIGVDQATISSTPSGWTQRGLSNAAGAIEVSLGVWTKAAATAGAYGSETANLSFSDQATRIIAGYKQEPAGGGAVGPLIGAGRIMGGSLNAGRLVRN